MNKREKLIFISSTALLLLGFLLMAAARGITDFADWYQIHIYKKLSMFWSTLYSVFPFSVFELEIYLIILIVVFRIIKAVQSYKRERHVKRIWASEFCFVWYVACMLLFLFVVHGGINYSASSFSEQHDLKREGYTLEELQLVCEHIVQELNELSGQVKRDVDGVYLEPESCGQLAVEAMEKLGGEYEGLSGSYPYPKGILASEVLSYEHLTGIYFPFTIEANYNRNMTAYNIPFTMCHELSHLRGYMREDEANFIAWLACKNADEVELRYSGALMGWTYCGNELYQYDKEMYRELRSALPADVVRDLQENSRYWDAHEGVVAEVSESVNDTYLKVNQQELGIRTYDRVVDLIVNYLLEE